MIAADFRQRLNSILHHRAITQKDLAYRIGLSPSAICRFMNNERTMSPAVLKLIADALAISPTFFAEHIALPVFAPKAMPLNPFYTDVHFDFVFAKDMFLRTLYHEDGYLRYAKQDFAKLCHLLFYLFSELLALCPYAEKERLLAQQQKISLHIMQSLEAQVEKSLQRKHKRINASERPHFLDFKLVQQQSHKLQSIEGQIAFLSRPVLNRILIDAQKTSFALLLQQFKLCYPNSTEATCIYIFHQALLGFMATRCKEIKSDG
ncbi:MAG: helix-turn-helix transcriptional regulator [Eubacteriales bacterium]|nr:helix-turn-helix transcriptional regulator [Eubacteriales bacterium]